MKRLADMSPSERLQFGIKCDQYTEEIAQGFTFGKEAVDKRALQLSIAAVVVEHLLNN